LAASRSRHLSVAISGTTTCHGLVLSAKLARDEAGRQRQDVFTVTTAHVLLIWICICAPVMAWHFWLHS